MVPSGGGRALYLARDVAQPSTMPDTRIRAIVSGALLDSSGAAEGYVALDAAGRVVERGSLGAEGRRRASIPRYRGIVLPSLVNAHTHLGDSVWLAEPPRGSLADIVAPPQGLKHRLLRETPPGAKQQGMRRSLLEMSQLGTRVTLDFREEGLEGALLFRKAARGTGVRPFILGRPTRVPPSRAELRALLPHVEGVGLSAVRDVGIEVATGVAQECHRQGKWLALHVSEEVREPLDPILALSPQLLVHMCAATPSDLDAVAQARIPVAVCARANHLFGRAPPLAAMEARGIRILLGTDNAMFQPPDLFREMAFAYLLSRGMGAPVTPRTLVEAACVTPWEVLGDPSAAQLEPGSHARALALRLPPQDPYYQVCGRASERNLLALARSPQGPDRERGGAL